MFVQGLTKTTHIDQVDNGELSFELTISGDTYNALTYRSFRMPLYTEGKYDPSAVPEVLGSLGETSYEESSIDVSSAEALPDGWNFLLDGSKISVNGSFQTQKRMLRDGDPLKKEVSPWKFRPQQQICRLES